MKCKVSGSLVSLLLALLALASLSACIDTDTPEVDVEENNDNNGVNNANNGANNTNNGENNANNGENNGVNNANNGDNNGDNNGEQICTSNADCAQGNWCQLAPASCDGEGSCRPIPEGCDGNYDPVCGCDGQTYSNGCFASAAGVNVARRGECEPAPETCTSQDDCGEGSFCQRPEGSCEGEGSCAPQPDGCPEVEDPVCGCDGQTYSNGCFADAAGVSVASRGACEDPAQACALDQDCGQGRFCECDGQSCGEGVCADRPEGCDDNYEPVCGCDGVTYSNDCERRSAGTCLAAQGICEVPDDTCTSSAQCERGAFCEFEADTCGQRERRGRCQERPVDCPDNIAPVCGCDGVTYSNDCQRRAENAALAHAGACEAPALPCQSSDDCADGQFCECAGDACGEGEPGTCQNQPTACTRLVAPVCGCDNQTYNNDCERRRAGACLQHRGPCDDPAQECRGDQDCGDQGYCAFEVGVCLEMDRVGQCQPRPEGCEGGDEPVCGCDGVTYGNPCEAAAQGASIASEGACEPVAVSCSSNEPCAPGSFCLFESGCGEGDQGSCQVTPEACPENIDPVCGCDGQTYNNACEAHSAGVSVASQGACEVEPGACTSDAQCVRGQFCQFEAGTCDRRLRQGACQEIPGVCPRVLDPVCGCDGVTYDNSCFAAMEGVSLNHSGACQEPPPTCEQDGDCLRGQFCECAAGACGGGGQCADRPVDCPRILDPVCGCDGETYANDCLRQQAGTCLEHEGACEEVPSCGVNTDCDRGEFCNFADGVCGRAAGTCEARPLLCTRVLAPVCGCDGVTYQNACEANRVGAAVLHEGACEEPPAACEANGDCAEGEFCECEGDSCGAGTCQERPALCTREIAPVCSCDGTTYTNDCLRQAAGACLLHQGACVVEPDTCTSNLDCGRSRFCEFAPDTCGERRVGVCEVRPLECPPLRAPVCGCDGETYASDCLRQLAGASLAHEGACEVTPTTCTTHEQCGEGSYCQQEAGVCEGDGVEGTCAERPLVCPLVLAPVCGCDGVTYNNACLAALAGVNVVASGACEEPPTACRTSRDCAEGEFCECDGESCGAGTCQERPLLCRPLEAPVCGCDGETYANDCERRRAGACLEHEGVCEVPVVTCTSNASCARGQFCEFEPNTCNERRVGVCEATPLECPRLLAPVCGCDGTTYTNDCLRQQAGASLAHEGACRGL